MTGTSSQQQLTLRQDSITWTPTDDGSVVVLDLRTSRYLGVSGTAAVLWEAMVNGSSEDELVDALLAEYDVDAGTARRDVHAFVEDLRARDLVADPAHLESSRGSSKLDASS